jgi:mono/diheme cytochrome c family protein
MILVGNRKPTPPGKRPRPGNVHRLRLAKRMLSSPVSPPAPWTVLDEEDDGGRKVSKRRIVIPVLLIALFAVAPLALAEDGQELYDKKCAMCNGKDGVAKKPAEGSANFNDASWQEATTVDQIVSVTTEGREKMKPYQDKLSPDEIKLVAEYIETLK